MGYGECGGADGVLMMNLILRSIIAHGLRTWGGPARKIMELHGGHSFQSKKFNYNRTNTCFRLTQNFQHLSSFKITYHSAGLISFLSLFQHLPLDSYHPNHGCTPGSCGLPSWTDVDPVKIMIGWA